MAQDPRDALSSFVRQLAELARDPAQRRRLLGDGGGRVGVERRADGSYAVEEIETPAGTPLAVTEDRKTAFLTAAVVTALRAAPTAGDPWVITSSSAAAGELRELRQGGTPAAGWAAASQLLAGLLESREAIEFLAEAGDVDQLLEALALATGRMVPGNQETH